MEIRIILLILNEKLYQAGEIDLDTKERIEMDIKEKYGVLNSLDS